MPSSSSLSPRMHNDHFNGSNHDLTDYTAPAQKYLSRLTGHSNAAAASALAPLQLPCRVCLAVHESL